MKVNFRTSDFRRQVADAGALILKNRYFEQNPFLSDDGSALLSRPGLRKLVDVGDGPIRGIFSAPGAFNGDLFVVSYDSLYRIDKDLNTTFIVANLDSPDTGFINMAITAEIGETPAYLFLTDGRNLYVYVDDGYARGTLTGTPANNDVVVIDSVYYQFTNSSVDTGSPAGTVGNPWLVKLGLTAIQSFTALAEAINLTGTPGTDYSTDTAENPSVIATNYTASGMSIRAKTAGVTGDGIVTTETGAAISWSNGGTLIDGGEPTISTVQTPEDVGVIDVAVIASFVIVVPAQSDGFQGRFYWIEPGETTIDPTNFATAERSPDGIFGVKVFGDQFWLPGESTTEAWYVTGDATAPMRRLQGVVFDRGSWLNTAQTIHETLVVVDADGGVFLIRGGAPQRVSTPDIEEQIRKAMATQNSSLI